MSNGPMQMKLPLSKFGTDHLRAGCLRAKDSVREALKRALDGFDREEVAKELSRLVGEDVSYHSLNNWCAEGKTNRRFPLEYVKAVALITGGNRIINAALQPEFEVMDEDGKVVYEYGMMRLEDKVRGRKKRKLEEKAIRVRFGK